jgi:hypothetical protein
VFYYFANFLHLFFESVQLVEGQPEPSHFSTEASERLVKKTTPKSVLPLALSAKAILSLLVIFFALFLSFKQLLMQVGTDVSVLWVAYATHNTLKSVPTLPR